LFWPFPFGLESIGSFSVRYTNTSLLLCSTCDYIWYPLQTAFRRFFHTLQALRLTPMAPFRPLRPRNSSLLAICLDLVPVDDKLPVVEVIWPLAATWGFSGVSNGRLATTEDSRCQRMDGITTFQGARSRIFTSACLARRLGNWIIVECSR